MSLLSQGLLTIKAETSASSFAHKHPSYLQGGSGVQLIGCFCARWFSTWKKEKQARDKRNSGFWNSVFLCSEQRFFREKNIMKKRSCRDFFFPLLLNYFDSVAPGRWFPLPLLLPRSSSSFVKSFRCKKVNLLLSLFIFSFFNEQLQTCWKKKKPSWIILYRRALQNHYGRAFGESSIRRRTNNNNKKKKAVGGFVCNNGRCHFKSSSLDSIENLSHRSRDALWCFFPFFFFF